MAHTRRFSYVLALACAALAGPAATVGKADHGEPYQSQTLTRYLEIAAAHWGGPAPTCTGNDGQSIQVHAVLYDDPDSDVAASAEQPGCRIWIDRSYRLAQPDQIDCTILVHEWGHLLGRDHSDDESSLMYESPVEGAPGCAVFGVRSNGRRQDAARKRRGARKEHRTRRGRHGRRAVARRMRPVCPRPARRSVAYLTRSGVPVLRRRPRRSTAVLCSRTQPLDIRPGIREGWFVP